MGPLTSPVSAGKVRLLFGARQTGKTELLRRVAQGRPAALFNLQDTGLRRRFEEDPTRFAREVRALPAATRHVLVDEIQKVPALLDEIQALHDGDPSAREFFLTGSSARRLRHGAANLLPGRAHVFHLTPVVRWEQGVVPAVDALAEPGAMSGVGVEDVPPFPPQSLERQLLFGSLPGVMREADATAAATLSAYVETYLEEEIRREAAAREVGAFSVFLRLAAVESGRRLNLAALSRESGVAQSTLKNFYRVLEDTFVGHRMAAYGHPGRKQLLSTPRFYLFDLGVRTAAAGGVFDPGVLASQGGELLEHWVGLELIHRARCLGRGFQVTFWRTTTGAEVDFVWTSPGEDLPIEVKWTRRPTPSDARHLEKLLDSHPRRVRRGLVVSRGEAREQLSDRVLAIPWYEL